MAGRRFYTENIPFPHVSEKKGKKTKDRKQFLKIASGHSRYNAVAPITRACCPTEMRFESK